MAAVNQSKDKPQVTKDKPQETTVHTDGLNLSEWNKKGDFEIVVGIDFGTDGSGVAWAMVDGNGEVFVDQEINGNTKFVDLKTKTNILLDENGDFIAFGREATEKYIRQIADDDESESDSESHVAANKKSASWLYFSQFKMALYRSAIRKQTRVTKQGNDENNNGDDDEKEIQKAEIRKKIKAANGRKLASRKIFVAALCFMKKHAFDMFKRHKVEIDDLTKIKWVLTVPAIWSDTSKGLMEQWAIEAGLITDKKVLNQLVIAYEPDCASISIRQEILQLRLMKQRKEEMKEELGNDSNEHDVEQVLGPNTKYMLLDLGGGTADIACHQVIDDYTVKEVYQPSGGAWGSTCIDSHFMRLLSDVFPNGWIKEYRLQHPSDYTVLMNNFCRAKEQFFARDQDIEGDPTQIGFNQKRTHNIKLEFSLIEFMEDKLQKLNEVQQIKNPQQYETVEQYETIEDFVSSRDFLGSTGKWTLNELTLELDYVVWTHMFDDVIDRIIDHCRRLLESAPLKDGQCRYLCLVGGFSASKYLQKRIIYELGPKSKHKLRVIIPTRPSLSVVEGAVRLGLKPDYIESRVLRKTYGIKVNSPISKWNLDELDPKLVARHRYYNKRAQQDYLHFIFNPFARKGDEVKLTDKPKTKEFYASKRNIVGIDVFESDEQRPVFIEGKPMARKDFKLPAQWDIHQTFPISFFFSDTTIRVFADIDGLEEHEKEIQLEYEL